MLYVRDINDYNSFFMSLPMDATNEIMSFLNGGNLQIVDSIKEKTIIYFTKWEKTYYASQLHKNIDGTPKSVEVFFKEPLEQSKFAHELLHMKTDLAIGDNGTMVSVIKQSNDSELKFILDVDFCTDLLNVTQHILFAPDLIEMGYKLDDQFDEARNYDTIEKAFNDVIDHKLKVDGKYHLLRVKNYLKLIVMYTFYPDSKRFASKIKQLKQIEYPLYCIVNNLYRAFSDDVALEESNREYIQEAYWNFCNDIHLWLERNRDKIAPFTMV